MQNKTSSNHPQIIDADLVASPGTCPPINEKRQYFQQLLPPPKAAIIWFTSPNYLTSLPQCSRPHYLVCASSIFLQPLTPSTTTYMYTQKTICRHGFGFRPTDTALLWIQSYPSSRSFSVKTSKASSQ